MRFLSCVRSSVQKMRIPGGFMHEVHGRLHLVHVLPARPARPRGRELDVLIVDLHLHLVHLGITATVAVEV
jgi:hypothetical protein